jgi:hypothetical protein
VLAEKYKKTKQDEPVYSLVGCYSSSFYFYSGKIRKEISPTDLKKGTGVLLLDEKQLPELARAGVKWKKLLSASDYEITRLTSKFLNPESRDAVCTQLLLVEF